MYFREKPIRNTTDMINLREASTALGMDQEYLSKKRSDGEWPKGVKLARKRTGLYMKKDVLPVLRQFYGVSSNE